MINQYVGGANTPRFALKAEIWLYGICGRESQLAGKKPSQINDAVKAHANTRTKEGK